MITSPSGRPALAAEADKAYGEAASTHRNRPARRVESLFEGSYFADVLAEHSASIAQMVAWRRMLAAHSSSLTQLIKSFPGTDHLDAEDLRGLIASRRGVPGELRGDQVFRPWANRWAGRWSDGSSQYHMWEQARYRRGQWIQRVVQSETDFLGGERLGALVRGDHVDLAINVFSEQAGITGWVSKRQHGRLEIPCVGYLLEPAMLFWICNMAGARPRALESGVWFAYLETVDASPHTHTYRIRGKPIQITDTVTWGVDERALHHGHYQAR